MALSIVLADEGGEFGHISSVVRDSRHGMVVRAETRSLRRAVRMVSSMTPDILLLGPRLPNEESLRAIRKASESGATRVVVMCRRTQPGEAVEALEAGAAAYLFSDTHPNDVIRILHTVAAA